MSAENMKDPLPICMIDPDLDCPTICWMFEEALMTTALGAIATELSIEEYKREVRSVPSTMKMEVRSRNKLTAQAEGIIQFCTNCGNIGPVIGRDQ